MHNDIYLVWETSPRVWDDIPSESQDFMKKYLESYPERPMVKLKLGQNIETEWRGKWWRTKVIEVDASLVLMRFEIDQKTEWIEVQIENNVDINHFL